MDVILNFREMDIEAEFDASGNPTPEFLSNIIQTIIQEYAVRVSDSEAFIYPELTASNCVFGLQGAGPTASACLRVERKHSGAVSAVCGCSL